jgi:hypothetical protein
LISEPTLRWIVTALFGVTIAVYSYTLVAQRLRWTNTVNHLLHVAMSVAMIAMAWRAAIDIPTFGPIAFFVLAGAWFVCLAARVAGDRATHYYYAVMMAAMAWMYAVMSGGAHAPSGSMAAGMDMSAHEMHRAPAIPAWITAVNWIVTLGFAVVALYWPCRYLAKRRVSPEPVYHAFTAAGTALMFGALL